MFHREEDFQVLYSSFVLLSYTFYFLEILRLKIIQGENILENSNI